MKLRDTVADLADSLELPEEAVSDVMRVTLIGRRRAERSGWGLQLPTAPGIFVSSEILRPGSPTATGSARQKWAIPWIRFSPSLP